MQTIEYRFRDKSSWGDGPWQSEPDKKQWRDEATGLPCLIVRGPSGALCGYVGIAEGHPYFGKSYDDRVAKPTDFDARQYDPDRTPVIAMLCNTFADDDGLVGLDLALDVHGGITFGNLCAAGEPEHGICHRPSAGEPDHVWWLGFDCAHSGDLSPKYDDIWRDGTYRTQSYVEAECASLAKQLKVLAA